MQSLIGAKKVGIDVTARKVLAKMRVKKRAEQSRDRSRAKIMQSRIRYKIKVQRNEEEMAKRKTYKEKLGPTCVSLMTPRKKAKQRRSAIGSLVPERPKFSQAFSHATRIYGKRFKLAEEGVL